MMNREKVLQETTIKLNGMVEAQQAVEAMEDNINEFEASGEKGVKELQLHLQEAQTVLDTAQDMDTARTAQARVITLTKEIELQKTVNASLVTAQQEELVKLVDEFFLQYKAFNNMFPALDKVYTLTMSISSVEQDVELLQDISKQAENALRRVKTTLKDQSLISQGERFFRGFHLDQANHAYYAKFADLAYQLQPIKQNLERVYN